MKIAIVVLLGLLVTSTAYAGFRSTKYGNTTYYHDDNGESGRATTYGNTTYYHNSNGTSVHCTQYGDQTYCS